VLALSQSTGATMHNLVLPFSLELKADPSDDEVGSFVGYGSTFGNVDLGKDICAKGCFLQCTGCTTAACPSVTSPRYAKTQKV
jgi:hypothetical protein